MITIKSKPGELITTDNGVAAYAVEEARAEDTFIDATVRIFLKCGGEVIMYFDNEEDFTATIDTLLCAME